MARAEGQSACRFLTKLSVLYVLLLLDLVMNVVVDFEDFLSIRGEPCGSGGRCLVWPLVLLGIHAVVQFIVFMVVFLLLSSTFPFRVGLVGPLFRQFRTVLYVAPAYLVATLGHGFFRVSHISADPDLATLWQNPVQQILYFVRLLVAVVFYLVHLRAGTQLGNPSLYDRDFWVAKYRRGTRGGASRGDSALT